LGTPTSNAYKLANDLENRSLLKRGFELDLTQLTDAILKQKITRMNPKNKKKLEEALAEESGCDKDFIIVSKIKIENSLFGLQNDEDKIPILIEKKNGDIQQMDTISSLFGSWRPITKLFVFCPSEYRDKIQQSTETLLRETLI
jgi:HD superfamily phosphohydrolase